MPKVLIKPKKIRPDLPVRFGTGVLLVVFVAILAGRFSLDRLSSSLPAFDLRLGFLYVLLVMVALWVAASHEHIPKPLKVSGAGLFVAWAGWLLASAAWAPEGARLGDKVLDLGLLLAFTLLAWGIMSRLPADATAKIWKWMLVAGLMYFALAMAEGPGNQGRYAAPGGGPNVFVRIMVLASIAALYFTSVKKKAIYLLPVPLFAVGAALSGSRGGLLSAGVIVLVFAIPICRHLGAKRVLGILTLSALGVWVFAWLNPRVVKFVEERYIQQTFVERYSSGRDTITEDALSLFQRSPMVGVGLDGYYALQDSAEQFEYPHNILIATMAESGVFGLFFIVAALLVVFAVVVRRPPIPAPVLYAAGAGFYQFAASLFSGDYYDTRLMWFFLGLAAIEAARASRDPDAAKKLSDTLPRTRNKAGSVTSRAPSSPAPRTPAQRRRRTLQELRASRPNT